MNIITPGTLVGNSKEKIEGLVYEENGKIFSAVVGLKEIKATRKKVTPLAGIYIPNKDDLVIGRVIDVYPNGWLIDINSPYSAFLLIKDAVTEFVDITKTDLNDYFTFGDFIVAKILNVTRNKLVNVTTKGENLGKIREGIIISVNPKKVPRIIGRGGSMIKTIKEITGVSVLVGQNGRVWIKTNNINLQILIAKTIKFIEENSHIKGLTDKVRQRLQSYIKSMKNG